MLSKRNRLLSDFDFRRVRKVGERFDTSYFSLFIARSKKDIPARFGFVISLKVSKSAAKRNRVRRVLTSEVEKALPQIAGGVEAAFFVRIRAVGADVQELRKQVRRTFREAGILKEENT
ncbi:ribonuclease P protein component [Candidatus Saccharibacteria bacterium]|nr:ribonuclease P protein component [Candidatus Saccharibacteria bacterium]